MNDRVNYVTTELRKTADDATATFGSVNVAQLNWKPAEKSWSVAQCFDHLITVHSMYFPLFERMANGDMRQSFWEKTSPLSGFFGDF